MRQKKSWGWKRSVELKQSQEKKIENNVEEIKPSFLQQTGIKIPQDFRSCHTKSEGASLRMDNDASTTLSKQRNIF